jgi:hypothetical protein
VTVCVFTCIAGEYDELKPHPEVAGVDFVAFTDGATCDGWDVVTLEPFDEHPRMAAKRYKILGPQRELAEYDTTIWIDGSHEILTAGFVDEAVAFLADSPMALHAHPHRDCVYDEADVSTRIAKYDGQPITAQAEAYRSTGHPEHWGLWAAGSIARARTPLVDAVMADWMAENLRWSFQDQISLPVVLRRHGLRPASFPHEQYHSPWLAIRHHRDGT